MTSDHRPSLTPKTRSYMEILFIDSDGMAQKTNMENSGRTDADTWASFNSFRQYGVDIKTTKFIIDYHNRKGDLADTIAIDDLGFKIITGQRLKSEAAYRKIDRAFWDRARKQSKAAA